MASSLFGRLRWASVLFCVGVLACAARPHGAGRSQGGDDRPPTAAGTLPGGRSAFLNPPAAQCRLGDCNRYGWTTTLRGQTTTAHCIASSCPRRGWTVTGASGSLNSPACRFSDCSRYGWNTLPDPSGGLMTSCPFADCNKHGWTTVYPDGRMETCRCRHQDCPRYGADCY